MDELKGTPVTGQTREAICEQMDELKTLAAPLVEWLRKHHNPLTEIRISWEHVEVKQDYCGVPFPCSIK